MQWQTHELAAGAEVDEDGPAAWLLGLYPSEYQMGTMLGSARRRFTFPTNSSSRLPLASCVAGNVRSVSGHLDLGGLHTCIQNYP